MRSQYFRFAVLLVLALGGCSTFTDPGAPDQSFDIDQDLQDLEKAFKTKEITVEDFYKNESPEKRDAFIAARLTLTNIQYIKFIRKFAVSKAQLDTAVDMLTIGVDLAITLVGAASTKAILGAISAGTTASKISIDKNFYYEKTVPVLITAMNAERKKALVPILKGTGKSLEIYSFTQALSELHLYYQAGTFIGALQAIQKDSGVKEEAKDIEIQSIMEDKFAVDEATRPLRERIVAWFRADRATRIPLLQDWLEIRVPPVSWTPGFWARAQSTSERALNDAIEHFNIPE